MSARLKLNKLKREMELIETHCRMREYEAKLVQTKCNRLLQENIQEIYPCDTMRRAVDCLKYNVYKITDSIVRKYSEQLAEFVQEQLTTKYVLNRFSTVNVCLLAPALNEDHVKVKVR